MQLQKEAEEKAAAAEAAPLQSASLEAKLQVEQEYSAWLLQRHKKVSSYLTCCCSSLGADCKGCSRASLSPTECVNDIDYPCAFLWYSVLPLP